MISWLRKLFRAKEPRTDPTFGKLTYMGGYWEGLGWFAPEGCEIEFFIDADEHGPGARNREAYDILCAQFPALKMAAVAAIQAAARQGDGPASVPGDLTVTGLDVPSAPLPDASWTMYLEGGDNTCFAVPFRGLTASGEVEFSA